MKQVSIQWRARFASLACLAVLLAGCARSPSAQFYRLTPLDRQQAQQLNLKPMNRGSVRIMPVQVPDYLDRFQIVTQDGPNVLKLAEFDRWAGSLGDNMTAVLVENLGLLLGSDRVFAQAVTGSERADYAVTVQVIRLDCLPGHQAVLKTRWAVLPGPGQEKPAIQTSIHSVPLGDARYDTLAAGVSRALGELSGEIARAIEERSKLAGSDDAAPTAPVVLPPEPLLRTQ